MPRQVYGSKNKKLPENSGRKVSEVIITDRMVSVSFSISGEKFPGKGIIGIDLNFSTIGLTAIDIASRQVTNAETVPVKTIARIQNDFSRRRQKLQKHMRNPKKRYIKLR
ncbi:MAG: hypothetical protein AAE977_02530 [Thermoplasmataceae archaeon]